MPIPELTKEEATKFFSDLYFGDHHIPGYEVKPYGYGWYVHHDRGDIATTDFNFLTRFVLSCHDNCIRGSVEAAKNGILKIAIWKRQRAEGISINHPTIEEAIENFRN